ncbi:MAG: hypothetical protein HY644_12500 [Acidobacteria bacterium]|nr:hypothetical protein [Acidobacteriota bacterium]
MQEECRRLFALLYLGLTLVEMQQRLNAPSVAAIKMRTNRCRKGLKMLLEKNGYQF